MLNLVVPTPGVGVYRSTQPGRALDLWPGTGRSHHLQRDRTRVRLQLQQGFSIGSAAVSHDSPRRSLPSLTPPLARPSTSPAGGGRSCDARCCNRRMRRT